MATIDTYTSPAGLDYELSRDNPVSVHQIGRVPFHRDGARA